MEMCTQIHLIYVLVNILLIFNNAHVPLPIEVADFTGVTQCLKNSPSCNFTDNYLAFKTTGNPIIMVK